MNVIKRDGRKQEINFQKISTRLKNLCNNLFINQSLIVQRVSSQIYDGVSTSEIDELIAQLCASFSTENPDYGILSTRIVISNNHKTTPNNFLEAMEILYYNKDNNGDKNPLVSEELIIIARINHEIIEKEIDYNRDYLFDYFGYKTLQKAYLIKSRDKTIERIQHMFMRISIGLHNYDSASVFKSYHFLSKKYFTHATPTLYHSGTPKSQCLSCFLLGTEDSVDGMYKTISDCAKISKWAGGIGVHISNIRSRGSYIRGNNGESSGIIPMLKVYNAAARHIDQAGKRKGSIAIYLEPYHPDIMDFLDIRKNSGNEEARTRDLFTALMIPDLFMKKLEFALKNPNQLVEWCLFDPDKCKELTDSYGKKFEDLYDQYEVANKYKEKIDITKIWKKILSSQIETGTPYIIYKDRVNEHSNQKNIGTIKSSNLCAEIVEYSDNNEYACCCLSSISLGEMVDIPAIETYRNVIMYSKTDCIYCENASKLFDKLNIPYEKIILDDYEKRNAFYNENNFKTVPQIYINNQHIGGYTDLVKFLKPVINQERLRDVCHVIVRNLNKVIDINYYPVKETERSNHRHRPLGIGVQGLSDLFFKLRIPFESEEAKQLNKIIFELIQYYCMEESCNLSKERENISIKNRNHHMFTPEEMELTEYIGSYSSFKGSPLSKGIFQFESMGIKLEDTYLKEKWNKLRKKILKYGIRNSLLVALMPTASTSQILGNNECFEPITSNIYTRRTLAGDFIIINNYLVNDLQKRNMWTKEVKDMIISANGSVQNFDFITPEEKELYKTVWEIKQKSLIDLSADRTPFICQTQSLNLFFEEPKNNTLGSALLYGWKKGLKTGAYYIRSRPKVQAQQFTIEPIICESCT